MKAKEYLMQIRKMDIQINQLVKEADDLKKSLSLISGIDYNRERVQTSTNYTPEIFNKIGEIYDIERTINALIEKYIKDKHRIIGEIQSISKTEYADLLYMRYVNYMSLEEISVNMGYSYHRIAHIHGEALKVFADKFLKVSKS